MPAPGHHERCRLGMFAPVSQGAAPGRHVLMLARKVLPTSQYTADHTCRVKLDDWSNCVIIRRL